jgi:hypothetical protein
MLSPGLVRSGSSKKIADTSLKGLPTTHLCRLDVRHVLSRPLMLTGRARSSGFLSHSTAVLVAVMNLLCTTHRTGCEGTVPAEESIPSPLGKPFTDTSSVELKQATEYSVATPTSEILHILKHIGLTGYPVSIDTPGSFDDIHIPTDNAPVFKPCVRSNTLRSTNPSVCCSRKTELPSCLPEVSTERFTDRLLKLNPTLTTGHLHPRLCSSKSDSLFSYSTWNRSVPESPFSVLDTELCCLFRTRGSFCPRPSIKMSAPASRRIDIDLCVSSLPGSKLNLSLCCPPCTTLSSCCC